MNPWSTNPEFDNGETALLNDRRRNERTAPLKEGTHLWLDGNRRMRVEVIDESDAGIGILIPDMSFAIGPRVELDFDQQRRTASVAYLNRQEDGNYRLGLEWARDRSE